MGNNCFSEWQTKVREQRRAREDAELQRMKAIPNQRAEARLEQLELFTRQLEETRAAIDAINSNHKLSEDQKQRALVKPLGAKLALESMLANAQRGYNKSLETVALVVQLQQRLEQNRDMADMKDIASSFPSLDFEKLLDEHDDNSEWVDQMREAVADTADDELVTTTNAAVVSGEIVKALSAPSASAASSVGVPKLKRTQLVPV